MGFLEWTFPNTISLKYRVQGPINGQPLQVCMVALGVLRKCGAKWYLRVSISMCTPYGVLHSSGSILYVGAYHPLSDYSTLSGNNNLISHPTYRGCASNRALADDTSGKNQLNVIIMSVPPYSLYGVLRVELCSVVICDLGLISHSMNTHYTQCDV
jgi:hypothetical protein